MNLDEANKDIFQAFKELILDCKQLSLRKTDLMERLRITHEDELRWVHVCPFTFAPLTFYYTRSPLIFSSLIMVKTNSEVESFWLTVPGVCTMCNGL